MNTIRGRVTKTQKLRNSVNGVPRYLVTIQDAEQTHTYETQEDNSVNFHIDNDDYVRATHTFDLDSSWKIRGVQ